jgi:multidrug efflux pump subunit AcrA (membrane-fusion protein)
MDQPIPRKDPEDRPEIGQVSSERVVAMALEFAARMAAAESLDEIYFALTNDLRALLHYERCFLITHLGGNTRVVAATHQPVLNKKSELQNHVTSIGRWLRDLKRPLVVGRGSIDTSVDLEGVPREILTELHSYMHSSDCTYVCCIPLIYNGGTSGHLLLEYFDANAPPKAAMMAVMKIAPAFAAALTARWILAEKPKLVDKLLLQPGSAWKGKRFVNNRLVILAVGMLCLGILFFAIPFRHTVGGEAVIVPQEKQYAFCKITGLIDKVFVKQGSQVEKGDTLATLDATDLDYKIRHEKRQYEILSRDMSLLQSQAIDDPSILAKFQLLELKRKNIAAELEYLSRQRGFLEIVAPVDGVIVTPDIETLSGKMLNAGEPFCEIAQSDLLQAVVYVPDERIVNVKKGQEVDLYLNNAPRIAYRLTVAQIAPRAEVQPRLGNMYEVKALFHEAPSSLRVGMKGIGKIQTGTANLWTMVTRRLSTRLNRFVLYF